MEVDDRCRRTSKGMWLSGLAALMAHGGLALALEALPFEEEAMAVDFASAAVFELVEPSAVGSSGDSETNRPGLAEPAAERATRSAYGPRAVDRTGGRRSRRAPSAPRPSESTRALDSLEGPSFENVVAVAAGAGWMNGGHGAAAGAERGAGGATRQGATGTGDRPGSEAGHGAPRFGPQLVAFGDPCAGFYPTGAESDHGVVEVEVRVAADGHSHLSRILRESPHHQGFGPAARACTRHLLFSPGRTEGGVAVESSARLRLRFARRSNG